MNSPLRFGILGAARVARFALLRPARRVPEIVVHSVAARDPRRARAYARRHGLSQVHASYAEMIDDPGIDAVYIALPNSLHAQWAVRALAAGKHVLCEKPLASNATEADTLVEAAAGASGIFAEGMHYRYHPLAARMRECVAQLGRLRSVDIIVCVPIFAGSDIRYQYALGGGALMDLGSYAVNLARFLVPGEPEVTAAAARLRTPGVDRAMDASLRFPDDVTARIRCALLSPQLLRAAVTVVGERGQLTVRNPLAPQLFHRLILTTPAGRVVEKLPPGPSTFEHQLRAFAAAAHGGAALPTSAAEGAAAMRVIDAIYRKAGLPVRGDPTFRPA
jgi:predicted dehydrogenase